METKRIFNFTCPDWGVSASAGRKCNCFPPSAPPPKAALAHPGLKLQTPHERIKTLAVLSADASRWADLLARNAYTPPHKTK